MSFGAAQNLEKAGSASSVYFNIIVAGGPEWSSFPGGQNSPLRYHFLVYWGGGGLGHSCLLALGTSSQVGSLPVFPSLEWTFQHRVPSV